MPNVDDFFKSTYTKANDLAAGDETRTIREVTTEKLGPDQEEALVVWFSDNEQGLPLNVTNARTISELYGPETTLWAGKKITLFRQQVEFAGKQVWGVRIRLPSGTEAPDAGPANEEGPPPQEPGNDSEIPF